MVPKLLHIKTTWAARPTPGIRLHAVQLNHSICGQEPGISTSGGLLGDSSVQEAREALKVTLVNQLF